MMQTNMTTQNITPKVSDKFEVGAILTDHWGCEQTNIDFYVIIARKGQFITVCRLKQHTSQEIGFMTNEESPILEINPNSTPIRKKIHVFDGKEAGFSFRNYTGGGWCNLWNGRKQTSTHYA